MKQQLPETGWKPVPGYENLYEIHPTGIVRSLHWRFAGHIISKHVCWGYVTVKLTKRRKGSTQSLHRLLALTFLPNPDKKPFVNHINGNTLDYSLDNLEWVTHAENMQHAARIRMIHFVERPVINICTNTVYPSMAMAARTIGVNENSFKLMLYNRIKNKTCFQLVA